MDSIPLFSIIMPVYGVEQYLAEAVCAVLAQTERDFELILVDDCSPDGCPAICDRYEKADPRVRVIHKPENGGLSAARNDGLAAARGAYVLFADSDDRLLPGALETCAGALQDDADVLTFGVVRAHENKKGQIAFEETLSVPAYSCETKADAAAAFVKLSAAGIFPFAWNKVFRTSFLRRNDLRFEEINLIEDFVFTMAAFSRTTRIAGVPDALYVYRKPAHETLVSRYRPEFFSLCKRKYETERAFLEDCGALTAENEQFICANHVRHLISVILRNRAKSAGLSRRERAAQIRIMLADAETREVLRRFRPASLPLKLAAAVLKTGNPALCESFARCIGLVRSRMAPLFAKRNRSVAS